MSCIASSIYMLNTSPSISEGIATYKKQQAERKAQQLLKEETAKPTEKKKKAQSSDEPQEQKIILKNKDITKNTKFDVNV